MMHTWLRDVRHAARLLAKRPGFSALIILTLALGIGANAAIFSIVHGVLLRPLPYPDPDRLVVLKEVDPRQPDEPVSVSFPNFRDWTDGAGSFEHVAAVRFTQVRLGTPDGPVQILATYVSREVFDVLGVRPHAGRLFDAGDDGPGAPAVAGVTHGFWLRRLSGDPAALAVLRDGRRCHASRVHLPR